VLIGVVIPTLNEESRIAARLKELASMEGIMTVAVVDGGSRDRTREAAASVPSVRVLSTPPGRALQMNAGAAALLAEGVDVLLFLHADVSLPPDAAKWIHRTLADPGTVAGAFRTWTLPDGPAPWWAPLLHLADLRSRYTRLPYGDQAMFVRTADFQAVGGYPEQPLMEDLELARRLRRRGAIRIVPARVRVSGRRFLSRPVFYTVAVNTFPFLYRAGVPPSLLKRLYSDVR
jgi:rSAM/selenodomain-associated transferase 2